MRNVEKLKSKDLSMSHNINMEQLHVKMVLRVITNKTFTKSD